MTTRVLLLILTFAYGCNHNNSKKDTGPEDASLSTPCSRMCRHFRELKCDEGNPIYDSDAPGPVGVPNTTCEMFCTSQMDLGVNLNTECAIKAPTCEEIEAYRAMTVCTQ